MKSFTHSALRHLCVGLFVRGTRNTYLKLHFFYSTQLFNRETTFLTIHTAIS